IVLLLALSVAGGVVWATHVPGEALEAAAVMALQRADATQTAPASGADGKSFADAPDLSSVGLRTVGRISASISPFARATGFVYRSTNGLPAVLLSVPDLSAPAQPQWQARRLGVSRVLSWTVGRTRYVLAGRADTRGLMRAADLMTAR
ncbi:MAG TPA: transcriptional regulator, partial [Paraburkholderia sp.]|nr:transcriptional regulator [Paraburkholderia sp.]